MEPHTRETTHKPENPGGGRVPWRVLLGTGKSRCHRENAGEGQVPWMVPVPPGKSRSHRVIPVRGGSHGGSLWHRKNPGEGRVPLAGPCATGKFPVRGQDRKNPGEGGAGPEISGNTYGPSHGITGSANRFHSVPVPFSSVDRSWAL
jgi:hypothetical protein